MADLQVVRKRLLKERQRLGAAREAIEGAGGAQTSDEEMGEWSGYDNHPADTASATYERTKDIALIENVQVMTKRLDRAIAKIDDGTYGRCDRCKGEISAGRLKANPSATPCVEGQALEDPF